MPLTTRHLRHQVTIQRPSGAVDDSGQPLDTWADVATTYAEKRDVDAREVDAAAQDVAKMQTVFRVRYREDVDATMRVLHNGIAHIITGQPMDPTGMREELRIVTERKVK